MSSSSVLAFGLGSPLPLPPPPSSSSVPTDNSRAPLVLTQELMRTFGFTIVPAGTPPTPAPVSATAQPRIVSTVSVNAADGRVQTAANAVIQRTEKYKIGSFILSVLSGIAMGLVFLKIGAALIAGAAFAAAIALSPVGCGLLIGGLVLGIISLCLYIRRETILDEAGVPSDLPLSKLVYLWLASLFGTIAAVKAGSLIMANM